MNYLVIKDNTITQICTSIETLLDYLEVRVTDAGIIEIGNDGEQLPTSYNMRVWSLEDVMKDVARYKLKNIEVILQIGIYKLERI